MVSATTPPPKPLLRGVLHEVSAVVAAVAGLILVVTAPSSRAAWAGGVYAASLVTLFSVSALYHRVNWQPAARAWMRRADHASIFVLIAGSYTPFALLSMPPAAGNRLLLLSWGGAIIGVVPSLFWPSKPKWLMAVACVALGWLGVPMWMDAASTIDPVVSLLLVVGGVFYSIGALFYALKRPALWPATFGYHELFHACTIVAAALHFSAAVRLIHR